MTTRRDLRAPRENEGVLCEPPWTDVASMLAANRAWLDAPGELLGRSLADLRGAARRAMLAAATAYHAAAGEACGSVCDGPVLMAGHQPEQFHPGVWVKNFALHGLARQHGGTPVNLVVDNDTAKLASLRLPQLADASHHSPRLVSIPFDQWSGETPYEEAVVRDEALFTSFAQRAAAVTGDWGFSPILPDYWQRVCHAAGATRHLGERLARGRRALERQWGCHNLEVPVSALCQTEPFAWFACHLLTHLERFHAVHNRLVRAYRHAHGIRSRNHPVPELGEADGWLEAPFWAWRTGEVRRGRLFVRVRADRLELRAGPDVWPSLPLGPSFLDGWLRLVKDGFKIRSRALTNTLYARLLLCDLFVHGIGGGKYDELTDGLLRDFYGVEAPGYLVLSATLLLPLEVPAVTTEQCRRLKRELRDLQHSPQLYLASHPRKGPATALLAEKRRWIGLEPTSREQRRERCRTLRAINEVLRSEVREELERVRSEVQVCEQRLEERATLTRRDYAFCLHPEATLRPFCCRFLAPHRGKTDGSRSPEARG